MMMVMVTGIRQDQEALYINRMANWMDVRNKRRDTQLERGHSRSWFRGESSWRRYRCNKDDYVPPSRDSSPPEERYTLRQLWQSGSFSSFFGRDAESVELAHQFQSENTLSGLVMQ
jgi:hypothetical protein